MIQFNLNENDLLICQELLNFLQLFEKQNIDTHNCNNMRKILDISNF
jgi:hypothetical protein